MEIDGVVKKLTAEDGETSVKAGHIHAFWIDDATPDYMTVILSASDSGMDYQLDRVFFENWYGYWTDALLHDGGLDWIQTLCVGPSVGTKDIRTLDSLYFIIQNLTCCLQTHDAGDHYTPAPAWMPFRRFFGYWTCVIVGRWIGGLLGYKPFFKEYTTDWDYAVAKMNGQPFIRRLIHSSYTAKTSWRKQVELSSGPKPTNAEFEEWVVDLAELASGGNKIATAGMNIGNAPINTNGAYVADGVAGANGYATGSQVSGDIARRKHHS